MGDKTYRQKVKDNPAEYGALVRLLSCHPTAIFKIITTALALLLMRSPEDRHDEVLLLVKRNALDKYKSVKARTGTPDALGEIETCVVCEKEFLSDGSNEVPVCMYFLVGVKRAEVRP